MLLFFKVTTTTSTIYRSKWWKISHHLHRMTLCSTFSLCGKLSKHFLSCDLDLQLSASRSKSTPVQRCPCPRCFCTKFTCTKFIDPRLSRFIARQYDRVIVFSHFCRFYRRCKIPKGTPLAGAINSRRGEKFGIFDRNCRLSRKRFEIGPRLP